MKTLRRHLNELTRRPQTISFDEIRHLVESAPLREARDEHPFQRWRIIMAASTLVIGAIAGLALLVSHGNDTAPRSVSAGAPSKAPAIASRGASTGATGRGDVPITAPYAALHNAAPVAHDRPAASGDMVTARGMLSDARSAAGIAMMRADSSRARADIFRSGSADAADTVFGVRLIELPADALARLGIRADTDGVWVSALGGSGPMKFSTHGLEIHDSEYFARHDLPRGPAEARLITDDLGGYRAYTLDESDVPKELMHRLDGAEKYSEEWGRINGQVDAAIEAAVRGDIGTLVPILVRVKGAQQARRDGGFRPSCIVWFRPVPQVLALLPAEIRKRITAELASVGLRNRSVHVADTLIEPWQQSSARMTGARPYLDLLRATDGAIAESGLAPNVTRSRSVVSVDLQGPRVVTVALVDIYGRSLRTITKGESMPAGRHELSIDVAGLPPAIYLVAITTDRGEQVVQRLIVPQ
jgi:hypothetical protein